MNGISKTSSPRDKSIFKKYQFLSHSPVEIDQDSVNLVRDLLALKKNRSFKGSIPQRSNEIGQTFVNSTNASASVLNAHYIVSFIKENAEGWWSTSHTHTLTHTKYLVNRYSGPSIQRRIVFFFFFFLLPSDMNTNQFLGKKGGRNEMKYNQRERDNSN